MRSPCERCSAKRRCTRRCEAWKKYREEQDQLKSTEVLRLATCKKCGAPIVWIQTPKGKWIPCDEGLKKYRQNSAGKESVVTDRGEVIRCDLAFDGWPTGMARTAHWATCPEADSFRRRMASDDV